MMTAHIPACHARCAWLEVEPPRAPELVVDLVAALAVVVHLVALGHVRVPAEAPVVRVPTSLQFMRFKVLRVAVVDLDVPEVHLLDVAVFFLEALGHEARHDALLEGPAVLLRYD